MKRVAAYGRWAAAVLSGLLLALSFPPFSVSALAWLALVPLLLAVVRKPEPEPERLVSVFWLGMVTGGVFWLVTLSWLFSLFQTSPAPAVLIILGWLILSFCCSLYLGAFALTAGWLVRRIGVAQLWKTALLTLLIPLLWAGWEVARSYWLTGFPWNLLGVSQYRNLVIIQIAQWVGVPGVSALVMLANTGIAFTVFRYLPPGERKYRPHIELFLALMVLAVCFRVGILLAQRSVLIETGTEVVVSAVQPAIPQVKKWSQEEIDRVHSALRNLTIEAARAGDSEPDLIVWPETATPYCITEEGESRELVQQLSREGAPLLVGSMDAIQHEGGPLYYNGSFLFSTNGTIAGSYYKQHLVPFGEYVPLSGWIPWLATLAPMGWNCEPGRTATVFSLGDPAWSFSSLICFEDIMADLSRRFVKAGARLLINQTNDAWFDRSAGPEQHLSQCVFRCVENRVPAIRVANTGISCLIMPSGAIVEATENDRGHAPKQAVPRWPIIVAGSDFQTTLYTRFGDALFGIPCAGGAVLILILAVLELRRKPTAR